MHTTARLEADKRLAADTSLPQRIAAQIRRDASFARADHPAGYAAIDAELTTGMSKVTKLAGAEQLIELERLSAHFTERVAEAAAEKSRLAKARFDSRLQQELDQTREQNRAEWAMRVGKQTLVAIDTLEKRLARLRINISGIRNEIDLRHIHDDMADVIKSTTASIALEHRASVARESANKPDVSNAA
jgi:hypothetical protein